MFRVGIGYDAHRLVEGRKLTLGGVEIQNPRGLAGHSDADVLTHAIMDAILGALGMGDIGLLFPDTDPAYKGASSLSLLREVGDRMKKEGFRVQNIDATIVAQGPKLASFFAQMRERIAGAIEADSEQVNIKATTTERMGFCGREEGMEAFAVVSLGRE